MNSIYSLKRKIKKTKKNQEKPRKPEKPGKPGFWLPKKFMDS